MASTFYVKIRRKQLGPIGVAELKKIAADGKLSPSDHVSRDGHDWTVAKEVKGLEFPRAGMPDPPPAAEDQSNGSIRRAPEFDPSELLPDMPATFGDSALEMLAEVPASSMLDVPSQQFTIESGSVSGLQQACLNACHHLHSLRLSDYSSD